MTKKKPHQLNIIDIDFLNVDYLKKKCFTPADYTIKIKVYH